LLFSVKVKVRVLPVGSDGAKGPKVARKSKTPPKEQEGKHGKSYGSPREPPRPGIDDEFPHAGSVFS
jgi:hypothetical protein